MFKTIAFTRNQILILAVAIGVESICLLTALGILQQLEIYRSETRRSRAALFAVERVLGDLRDAETGQRGYIITKEKEYLVPYYNGIKSLEQSLKTLEKTLKNRQGEQTSTQKQRLKEIQSLSQSKLSELRESIKLREELGTTNLVAFGLGKRLMDNIRRICSQIEQTENNIYSLNIAKVDDFNTLLKWVVILSLFTFFVIGIDIYVGLTWQAHLTRIELINQKEINQAKGVAIAQVAHDLSNDFQVIQSSLEIINLKKHLADSGQKHLKRMLQALKNATSLLEDMILVSQAEAEGFWRDLVASNFKELAESCIEEILPLLLKNHRIELIVTGQEREVLLDPHSMRRAIANLLNNAIKYSPEGKQITVTLAFLDKEISVTVADQGLGIPAENIPDLFEVYYRASNTQGIKGTGLGLALIKTVAQFHEGSVSVESELGVGSRFKICLPQKSNR